MNNTLVDNTTENLSLKTILKQCISDTECQEMMIATGYWDLPGMLLIYDELKCFFEKGGKVKLLIGQEPLLRAYQKNVCAEEERKFPDFYMQRDFEQLTEEYKPLVKMLLQYCGDTEAAQLQIRIFGREKDKRQFLHAKCYIFIGGEATRGIIGSSNFTKKGLEDNAELNYLEANPTIVTYFPTEYYSGKSHVVWFKEKWEVSELWSGLFIEEILKPTPIYKKIKKDSEAENLPLTPYELYIKLLQFRFADLIDKNAQALLESYLPANYERLEFQLDAVNQCFSIMKQHGGFMLADVVGLGKTIVGILIIKRFLDFAELDGRDRKVLIVTPPAIKSAWRNTIEEFDKNCSDKIEEQIDFITTGSIGKLLDEETEITEEDTGDFNETLEHKNYGLILIDESHKFRNSNTVMYESLDNLIREVAANTGHYPYIGLLSATPQNNKPNDLKNQIYLFQRNHTCCTLDKVEGHNLERFFTEVNSEYQEIIKHDAPDYRELIRISERIRDVILCDILVRRTRTDIQKYYPEDMEHQNICFPSISGPHSLKYKMDALLCNLFNRTMDLIAPNPEFLFNDSNYLCYYRYRAIEFFESSEYRQKYAGRNSTPERTALQLARIMQILLVKRLESSFSAFKSSLHNLQRYTQNMITMFEKEVIFICPQIDVNKELDTKAKNCTWEQCFEDIRQKIKKLNEAGKNERNQNAEYVPSEFCPEYLELLRKDKALIDDLCDEWDRNDYDPKLDVFKEELKSTLFNPVTNENQKLVIFSEAIDTVKSLKRVVENKGYQALVITAKNRDEKETEIRENFDANYKGEWKDEYQVIITTEVLAEGVNLHRANCILNYDTPWNSTRLMQRIGRVNRIGSTAGTVYVYNFMPSAEGDEQIHLIQKAYTKLQSFHTLFGEDSKIYSEDELVSNYELKKMVNGDESPYEKYLSELKQYRDKHPERYKQILYKTEDLCLAVAETGNALFVVKTPKINGLFIEVSPEGKSEVISSIDMFRKFKCNSEAQAVPLPESWEMICKKAILVFNQYLVKLNTQASKDKPATRAKGIIKELVEQGNLSEESKELLDIADKLIRKGNKDIIRKIVNIYEQMHSEQSLLFDFKQEDIDAMIHSELKALTQESVRKHGEAYVYMGLAKTI